MLYEDNHIIAVNKRPSEIVQGDKTGDLPLSETVKSYIKRKYNKPGNVFLGVVHRLDRPVSGVVLFARTGKALERLNGMLRRREIRKLYWAIVKELPGLAEGEAVHYLVRDRSKNKSFPVDKDREGAKEARLLFRRLKSSDRYHLLEIDLLTGRHHQIRAQLSAMGAPVKGDLKYGSPRSNPDASISLHARRVTFTHPVSKKVIDITADPPEDPLWEFFLHS